MNAVVTVFLPAERIFPDHDEILALFGRNDRRNAILKTERGILRPGKQLATLAQDRDVGIEDAAPETHRFDLGGQALPFGGGDNEVIQIVGGDGAVDRGVERNLLRLGGVGVRLKLRDVRERAHPERADFGNAGGGAQTHLMFAETAVGGERERGFDPVRRRLHRQHGDAGCVENDFLRVVETLAGEAHFEFCPALPSDGKDVSQARRNRVSVEGQTTSKK